MGSTVQVVDSSDAVLYDLNDATGANNAGVKTFFGVRGSFGLGSPDTVFTTFEPTGAAGGVTTYDRDGLMVSQWTERFAAGSYQALRDSMGLLSRYLRTGGTILFTPDGSDESTYIDFEPSPAPALFGGSDGETRRAMREYVANSLITLRRQPYLRDATLDSDTNALGNASTMLVAVSTSGRPDNWAWSGTAGITSESIDSSTESYKFTMGTAATRTIYSTYSLVAAAPGDVWSASGDAWAETAGVAQCSVVIEYLTSAGSAISGGTATGTLTPLNPTVNRLTVTSAAAPATTAYARMGYAFTNNAGTAAVHLRRPQLEHAATVSGYRVGTWTISNDPAASAGRILPIYNPGDARSPVAVRFKWTDAAAKGYAVLVGTLGDEGVVGRNSLTGLMSGAIGLNLGNGTLGSDTTDVNDNANDGSSTHCAKRTFATVSSTVRQSRISPGSVLGAGDWDVYCRFRVDGSGVFGLRGMYGASDPAPFTMGPEISHDTTLASSYGYVDRKLGTMRLKTPSAISAPYVELWTRRASGSGSLYANHVSFVPASRPSSLLSALTGASEAWTGDLLLMGTAITSYSGGTAGVNGTVKTGNGGLYMELDSLSEATATPPAAGEVYGAARHIISIDLTTYQPSQGGTAIGEIRVRDISGTADVSGCTITLKGSSNEEWWRRTVVFQFDGTAGHAYQPQVWHTQPGSDKIGVYSVDHQVLAYAGQNESFSADPRLNGNGAQHLNSSFAETGTLTVVGALPLTIDGETTLNYVHTLDVPLVGYSEGKSVRDRVLLAHTTIYPLRYQ